MAIEVVDSERHDSFDEAVIRASIRLRAQQALRTPPAVLVSLVALYFGLRGRVAAPQFYAWEVAMASTVLIRAGLCTAIRRPLETADTRRLARYELYLWASAILNAVVIGSSFWMVAATGDLTVRVIMTLASCFYAVGALVNAASHFPSFAVVTGIHLGQGILFWLGVGSDSGPQLAVAFPYAAVALLMIGFGRDYSRQFRDSIRIRTENSELLAQLERDKKVIESALKEAKLASESKSRFLAAASHDLRQPLHALTMFVSTLTFHVGTEDARRLLNKISETANLLEEQFDSLLDLSRFEVGAIQADIKPFRLDSAIERVIEEVRSDAESRKLTVMAELCPAVANCDPLLVTRVLQNLVQNAVKYTVSGSVVVRVTAQPLDFVVEVIDTGPGIPADQQTRIFEEYVQLGNPGRQRRYGVGLGLAIVRRIDALLHLGLELTSQVGSGSRFSFKVPRADSAQTTVDTLPRVDITAFRTSATVWLLDDDPNSLDGLREQLAAWGARVSTFSTPEELLQAYGSRSVRPDWIFSDDMLGAELSGLDTAQMLQRDFGHSSTCLITGNTDPRRLIELRSSGFPVIIKPTRPALLISVLTQ